MNSLSQLDRNKMINNFMQSTKAMEKVNFIAYSLALKEAKNSVVKLEAEELLKKCELPKEENL